VYFQIAFIPYGPLAGLSPETRHSPTGPAGRELTLGKSVSNNPASAVLVMVEIIRGFHIVPLHAVTGVTTGYHNGETLPGRAKRPGGVVS